MTLSDIQAASGSTTTYRAYGHAMAAQNGLLITAPLALVDGRLTALVDACPVQWQQAVAVLHTPVGDVVSLESSDWRESTREFLRSLGDAWRVGFACELKAVVFERVDGLRVGMAAQRALRSGMVGL
ncbi:hypothetical protein DTO96_102550 [Ephemeroptericola cinctiostellae]|uniref:Uncharacterized protein n=1 Tax=Ephemeroptericola cinctiostellae TaxID=2268024 RepID=A0A345DEK6_9BURK|nr:hypothetical protein [Ephemeroptericola cinctiostellae]AXF86794.1 hypothetical protein DTO96_102550 [Ephemeroptericola cinctiostellae]